jgi:hypothetical protein
MVAQSLSSSVSIGNTTCKAQRSGYFERAAFKQYDWRMSLISWLIHLQFIVMLLN